MKKIIILSLLLSSLCANASECKNTDLSALIVNIYSLKTGIQKIESNVTPLKFERDLGFWMAWRNNLIACGYSEDQIHQGYLLGVSYQKHVATENTTGREFFIERHPTADEIAAVMSSSN